MPRRWYAATVKPSCELLAERELRQQGFAVFNPRSRIRTPKRGGGERLRIIYPFAGYIFVRFDVLKDRWQVINNTRGAGKLVPFGLPSAIRRGVVEQMIRETSDGFLEDEKIVEAVRLDVGDHARLPLSSAFAGFVGEVLESSHDRIRIMLDVFGRRTEVEVPLSGVVKA